MTSNSKHSALITIYYALLHIRAEAQESGNKKIYQLADLLHNIPHAMLEDQQFGDDVAWRKIEQLLVERGKKMGYESLVNNLLKESRSNPTSQEIRSMIKRHMDLP